MTIGARKVATSFGWQALATYSNRVFGLVTTLILAKVLTPHDFGLVAIASMILELLQLLRDMGLSEALIYNKRDDHAVVDTAHVILVAFNALLFLLAAGIAPFAARFYDNDMVTPVVIVMSSNLVWDSLRSVPRTLIRKNIAFDKLVIPETVPVFVSCLTSIAMALTGFGVWSLVAKSVIHSLLGLALLQRVIDYRPRFVFNRAAARELYQYGKFILGATMMFVLLYNIDRFYVSKVAGVAALGLFELARNIADMPVKQFTHVVGTVMFPVFSRMDRGPQGLQRAFLKTLKYTSFISVPMAVGISAFGPPLLYSLYGTRWEGMLMPLRYLAVYALFRSLSSLIHDAFKAAGRPGLMMQFVLVRLAAIGILGIPALQEYGLVGISALIAVTYAIVFLFEMVRVARLLDFGALEGFRIVAPTILLAAATIYGTFAVLVTGLGPLTVWKTVAGMVCAGALYSAAVLLVDRRSIQELAGALRAGRAA